MGHVGQQRNSGSAAHSFRLSLARHFRDMPKVLKGTQLRGVLYHLGSQARASGELRNSVKSGDDLIPPDELAKRYGMDPKEFRQYLAVAEASGLIHIHRPRGRSMEITVLVASCADWDAAAAVWADVRARRQVKRERKTLGDRSPRVPAQDPGGPVPEGGLGDRSPRDPGGPVPEGPPISPGSFHVLPHDLELLAGQSPPGGARVPSRNEVHERADEIRAVMPGRRHSR